MIHHGEILRPENTLHVLVGVRVERQGIGSDTVARQLLHRALGVIAQVLRIAYVIVGGFTIAGLMAMGIMRWAESARGLDSG